MCGLAGILLYPTERSEAEWQAIGQCFAQTLLYNEERGREASGVALIRRSGAVRLFKGPVPASELVRSEEYRTALGRLDAETTCLLGHARAPTKGSRWNNANNHPLLAGQVIGIHNGHIHNDDELFAEWGFSRLGQVDSEIIFRLLDAVPPDGQSPADYLPVVQERIALLQGRFATLSVHLNRPEWLLVLRNGMPLCVHYHRPWQALCFSSRYLFLRKAFGREVITERLDSGQAYLFDATRLPELGGEPIGTIALE